MYGKWMFFVMLASGQVFAADSDNTRWTRQRKCVLPSLPKNGWHVYKLPVPRSMFEVELTIICKPPHRVDRPAQVNCTNGQWTSSFAKCVLFCELPPHPSVTYTCISTDPNILDGERKCNEDEPSGTEVIPKCNDNYYSSEVLKYMYCDNGTWDYVATCQPAPNATLSQPTTSEIRVTDINTTPPRTSSSQADPPTKQLEAGTPGSVDISDSEPDVSSTFRTTSLWHVAIYERKDDRLDHVCGGSLIKEDLVISAGHCFWSPVWKELPATQFKVAAGKIYSQYNDPRDTNAQYSDVKNITITEMAEPCRQPDVAAVELVTPFMYTRAVKPVCLSYDKRIRNRHLAEGNTPGVVASWAVQVGNECRPSGNLHWLSLPFVNKTTCQGDMRSNTTGQNRHCAGHINNPTHCEIDSGNGLVFYVDKVPYLRAVTTNVIENPECTKFLTRSFSGIISNEENYTTPFGNFIRTNLFQCKFIHKKGDQDDIETVTEFIPTDPIEDDGNLFETSGVGGSEVPKLPGTSAPIYQWHVGIYSKLWAPYKQICGGSLVKRDFVISAAHCFWDDVGGQQRASQFAVAGGKVYRPWNITQDTSAQQSDVSQITLPVHFRGATTSFQDDIAILRLRTPFTYAPGVQPVCVNFDLEFVREQLQAGVDGTVCGWGLTGKNGLPSQVLTYLKLPYLDLEDCYEQFADYNPSFLKYITSDKICAGFRYIAKALCRGDSGGGYVIHSEGTPYLHAVASTAASNKNLCNTYTIGALTSVFSHRTFIRDNIPDIEKECARLSTPVTTERNEITENVLTAIAEPTGNAAAGIGDLEIGGQADKVVPAVVGIGNGGWNMMEDTRMGNAAEGATTAFPQSPYPYQFICNCNCKP